MEKATCPGDPTNACVYETVHFDAGMQHMDGARALIYARSRHAEGDEGSDFARSRRQQELVVSLKNKLMHPLTWFSLSRIKNLSGVLDDATDMDMSLTQVMTIGKRFVGVKENEINKISIDDKLETPPSYVYGRYVLVPKKDWNDVHAYIQSRLER
jgi:anionic cell wall polymer biosynthesis LytR-Cps2A-Psr (LCP) family protein